MHSKTGSEDKALNLKHGDVLLTTTDGKFAFRFRCGPAGDHWSWRKNNGLRKAFGSLRKPRTLSSLRAAEAHSGDIRVRSAGNHNLPHSWNEVLAHAEKNWKRYRSAQYRC